MGWGCGDGGIGNAGVIVLSCDELLSPLVEETGCSGLNSESIAFGGRVNVWGKSACWSRSTSRVWMVSGSGLATAVGTFFSLGQLAAVDMLDISMVFRQGEESCCDWSWETEAA